MSTKLLFLARGGRRKIEVTEIKFSDAAGQQRTERAYSVTGAKLRDGSLSTDRWTADEIIERAIARFREGRPKAALSVSVCDVCGVGYAPDRECSHSRSTNEETKR